jgi:hypothetical protein
MALDKTDLGIAIGGAAAFILGFRRTAGAIWGIGGIYELSRGVKVGGTISSALGASLLFFPDWPADLGQKLSGGGGSKPGQLPAPTPFNLPETRYINYPSLDRPLDGGWTMLDVRDLQEPWVKTRALDLHVGDVATLVLEYHGGQPAAFNARVIGGSSGTLYQAQWASTPPQGGPQMAEFGREHVYTVHPR